MRLFTRTGATALDHPAFGHFDADELGGFDFPNELSDQLHGFSAGGRPLWETDIERQHRTIREELERRRDPATLMDAVAQLVSAAQAVAAPAPVKPVEPANPAELAEDPALAVKAPAKRASKRASASTPPAAE